MKILFLGDPLSPNLQSLINKLISSGCECRLVSLYDDQVPSCTKLKSLFFARSPFLKSSKSVNIEPHDSKSSYFKKLIYAVNVPIFSLLYKIVFMLRFIELPYLAYQFRSVVSSYSPDILIAYRTQFEGYVASLSAPSKFILFTQGSDFIYFAFRNPCHYLFTLFTISKSKAIISDNSRDVRLLKRFFASSKPSITILGNAGIDIDTKNCPPRSSGVFSILSLRTPAPYIDYDTFFSSISKFTRNISIPVKISILASSRFHYYLLAKARRFGVDTDLLDFCQFMDRDSYIRKLAETDVVISPSLTDGLPVSLVEAMYLGCFPIVQRLASLEDVIVNGRNGFMYDSKDSFALANFLLTASKSPALLISAANYNKNFIHTHYSTQTQLSNLLVFLRSHVASL